MRPRIGVPCRARDDKAFFYINKTYIHALEDAGGAPIVLPLIDNLKALSSCLSILNGLLLPGGIDLDPGTYQETPHCLAGDAYSPLDEFEIELVQWAMHHHIPTLGICRGMQLINVALGGTLYQDIAAQYPGSLQHADRSLPRNTIMHHVSVQPGSLMEHILGQQEVPVNSLHHQAVKDPGAGVVISGCAEDGIAELLEVPAHPFMVAAQCHPEELYKDWHIWANLFQDFIYKCEEHRSLATTRSAAAHTDALSAITKE